MDIKVKEAQEWLNSTYSGHSWFTVLDTDGITGAGTCKALCKALQYEIGLSGIDGIIGTGTLAACPTIGPSTTNSNLVKIIQCGFYCKGYECGGITGIYSSNTINAATAFRSNVGFSTNDGTMPPRFIKALLNTDAFVLISSGHSYIRNAQQYLNTNYIEKFSNSWNYIPCNGVADRNMMKAIIAALQYEEAGQSLTGVDGIYGNNTLSKAPFLSPGTTKTAFVKIAQMCLMCMMETDPGLDGVFDTSLASLIIEFQTFYCLDTDSPGRIDTITWASLLSSKGYTSRNALACDTSTILDYDKALALYNKGYQYVGRYLTGTVGGTRSKAMTQVEVNHIFNAGLRIFAIFQEGTVTREKFTYQQGRIDGETALNAAKSLGIPYGEIIYFAIDYDMTDNDVTNYVIPYFRGIRKAFNDNYNRYKTGIYGSRNVCSRVAARGYSVSSFVSDMSTGFSGNLGYKIPDDWAFDQFHEYTFTNASESFGLDKVAYSGRYNGFNQITSHLDEDVLPTPTEDILLDRYKEILRLKNISFSASLELDKTYTIDTPIMLVEYSAAYEYEEEYDTNSDNLTTFNLDVINGTISSTDYAAAENLINNLDTSIYTEFDAAGGMELCSSITNEITNGTVIIGIGVSSSGHLKISYTYKVKVWEGDYSNQFLFVKISFTFRNKPATPELQEQIAYAKTVIVAVPAAIVIVSLIGVLYYGFSILGTNLCELICAYLAAIKAGLH